MSREDKGARTGGGRQTVSAALALVLILFFLPVLALRGEPVYRRPGTGELPNGEAVLPADPTADPALPTGTRDRGRAVRLLNKDGTVAELTMADYIWGVVAAEMPASFEEEALKAQACAARTYTALAQNRGKKHPDADICAVSSCCQAYIERSAAEARWGLSAKEYAGKIQQAVEETDSLGILYNGAPIQALFFSSAAGRTVDAVEVWGSAVDYLKSVDSPEGEEVPNYRTQVQLAAQEVRQLTLEAYPGADLSGEPGSDRPPGTRPAESSPSPWAASPSPGDRSAPSSPCARPALPWIGTGSSSPLMSQATDTGWA